MFKKINRAIKVLISSYFLLSGAWFLVSPIFAIFLLEDIEQNPMGVAKVAGFASLIYWVLKSVLQIPVSNYLDNNHGEKDDFWFLIIGISITSLVPIGFAFSDKVWQVYFLQVVYAIGMSMVIPSRSAMFTRHIDKGQEAYEWAMNSTCLGLASGVTSSIGGVLASIYGFRSIFFLVSLFSFSSALVVFLIKDKIYPTNKKVTRVSPYAEG